jgi:hypothetical protein
MAFTDRTDIPGYFFQGLTKGGQWGKWLIDNGRSQEEREQWQQEQQIKRQQRAEAEAQQRAATLPADDRDRHYRQLLDQLTLHPIDRADLQRRGLTDDQIAAWGFKSVEQWQRLKEELPHTLPGVNLDGRSLNIPYPGYLCPVLDTNGRIVDFQVRNRNPKPDQPKYYWLTSKTKKRPNGPTPLLSNGELPIGAFCSHNTTDANIIYLAEGFLKPQIAAFKLGATVLGADNANFAGRPQTLAHIIQQLELKFGCTHPPVASHDGHDGRSPSDDNGRSQPDNTQPSPTTPTTATQPTPQLRFVLLPDAGAVLNPHVMNQYRATWELLQHWGYTVQVAWWGQITKNECDIDELSLDALNAIQLISPEEFIKISRPERNWIARLRRWLRPTPPPPPRSPGFKESHEPKSPDSKDTRAVSVASDRDTAATLVPASRRGRRAIQRLTRIIAGARRQQRLYFLRAERHRKRVRGRTLPGTDHQGSGTASGTANYRTLVPALVVEEFPPGERTQTYQRALDQGFKHILDQSRPGTGKSFDSGNLSPGLFGVRQIIYLSDQHRNPTVETLEIGNGWVDMEARHGGLSRVVTPGGNSRLQRSVREDIPSIPANCCRNGVIGALRDKNISGADTASLICGSCQRREPCTNATGYGYGYLNQRHSALSSPLLRAHPDSLPDPREYDYSEVFTIWDEPGQTFRVKRQVQVMMGDFQQTMTALMSYPDLFAALLPLMTVLLSLLDGTVTLGKFGKNFHEVRSLLPDVSHLDPESIFQALVPNLRFLNTTEEFDILYDQP